MSRVSNSVKQINSSMAGVGTSVRKLAVVKSFKPAAAQTGFFSGKLGDLKIAANMAGISVNKFNKTINELGINFAQGIGFIDKFNGKIVDNFKVSKMASVQAKRFKMEWLGIMFAGMALDRAFGGLLRTQLQLWGVSEGFSSMWATVMAPVMELITPLLWGLIDAFMNMPEWLQLAVGSFVLLGAALGKSLGLIGQMNLGIQALKGIGLGKFVTKLGGLFKTLFAGVVTGIKFVIANFLPIAAVIAGLALIFTGVYMIFKKKFEGIGLIIMGIGAILLLFIGWWALIPIAVGAAVFLIIKHWGKVKTFFAKTLESIKSFFSKLWDSIKAGSNAVINFLIGGINKWISGYATLINFAIKGINKLINLINKIPGVEIGTIGEINIGKIPSFQSGGLVDNTGMALVHKGERVIPRSEVNRGGGQQQVFSPTVNIEVANMSSDVDIDRLAQEINRRLAPQFEGFAGRGTI